MEQRSSSVSRANAAQNSCAPSSSIRSRSAESCSERSRAIRCGAKRASNGLEGTGAPSCTPLPRKNLDGARGRHCHPAFRGSAPYRLRAAARRSHPARPSADGTQPDPPGQVPLRVGEPQLLLKRIAHAARRSQRRLCIRRAHDQNALPRRPKQRTEGVASSRRTWSLCRFVKDGVQSFAPAVSAPTLSLPHGVAANPQYPHRWRVLHSSKSSSLALPARSSSDPGASDV